MYAPRQDFAAAVASVGIHLLIAAAVLVLLYARQGDAPKLPSQPFVLVDDLAETASATAIISEHQSHVIKFHVPQSVVSKPTSSTLRPTETRTTAIARPVQSAALPRPQQQGAGAKPPRVLTKPEFDQLYGKPAVAQRPVRQTSSAAVGKPSRIAVNEIITGLTNAGPASENDGSRQLDSYISQLIQRLRAAHEKPPGLSDLLEARVQFRIAADGTISGVKIVGSSGSSEYDQSVLEAFARVRSIGKTPNGKSDTWIVTFKMREEE